MDIGIRWNDLRLDFGACDYHWSNLSGVRYAYCGGRCDDWTECGASCLAMHAVPGNMHWYIGACDYGWSDCSGLRYPLYGGWITIKWDRGISVMALDRTPEWIAWSIGACDSYMSELYGIQYVMSGGRCAYGADVGLFYRICVTCLVMQIGLLVLVISIGVNFLVSAMLYIAAGVALGWTAVCLA